jgi:hypothetical protein
MGLFLLQLQDWTYKMKTKFWFFATCSWVCFYSSYKIEHTKWKPNFDQSLKVTIYIRPTTLAASLIILLSEMLNISKKSANNMIFWREILNIQEHFIC